MVTEMYKKRVKASLSFSGIVFLLGIVVFFIDRPNDGEDWLTFVSIGIMGLMLFITGMVNKRHYARVKDLNIEDAEIPIIDSDHFVVKKDVGSVPRLLFFQKDGRFLGLAKPVHIPIYLYPFFIFSRDISYYIPITYGIFSHDGSLMATYKRKGWKESVLTVMDQEGYEIGTYIQKDFKSFVNIKGELLDGHGERLLPVEVNGFTGDFTLKDREGNIWAHFLNGYFPFEATKTFRDVHNDLIEISDGLSPQNKRLLLAMISFIFLARNE